MYCGDEIMILIIDNQSAFLKKFKRQYLSEQDIECLFLDHNQPIIIPKGKKVKGIILSGGKGTPYEPLNLTADFVSLMNFDVPVLGFCLGHEIIAVAYRGRIKRMPVPQIRKELVTITKLGDVLFDGLPTNQIMMQKKHHHHVVEAPPGFLVMGYSEHCAVEIMRHPIRLIYSFQGHPEVSGPLGVKIVENFFKICGVL